MKIDKKAETVFVDSNGLLVHEYDLQTDSNEPSALKNGQISILAGEDDLDEEELDSMIRAFENMK